MYLVRRIVITKDKNPELFSYMDKQAHLACNLYNTSLFRIRQIFIGWDKPAHTANENEVFAEVALLLKNYPSISVRRVISYKHLEKLMRVTKNPDFFAGLPMQTAQAVVKQAIQDFKNWLASCRAYKKNPSNFNGKPRMPHYKKPGTAASFSYTNQDAVVYPLSGRQYELKLPLTKERVPVGTIDSDAKLCECKIKPYYGRYLLLLTFETDSIPADTNMPNMAAIDFGCDNIAAIVSTDGSSRLYKGGAILSENRFFAMNRAKAVGIITKGHKTKHCANSRHLDSLSYHHSNFNTDQCHKISRSIITWCITHRVGTLVLGVNKDMKQNINTGRANNQLVYGVPLCTLRQMITYKAQDAGITIIEQEESYTSKASCVDGDFIPVFGVNDQAVSFSGVRTKRGLYRCSNGMVVNADLNGAANILKKAIPAAWSNTSDWSFLQNPEVSGFHELNPQSIPAKRIAAV